MRYWRRLKSIKSVSGVLIAAGLLIVLNGLGWVQVAGFAQDSVRPLSSTLTSWGRSLGFAITDFGHAGGLSAANKQLQDENARLLAQVANLQETENENQQLRQQLQFGQKSMAKLLGADIIGYQPDGVRQILSLNRGSADGVKVGMVAVLEGNLIGKVDSLNAHTSQMILVSDQEFRVLVVDQNSRTPGIVKGQAGGSVLMERIPQTESIKPDDIIITSGTDGEFPAGLVVGTVSGVSQDSQSIFNTAQIHQAYHPISLRVVMLVVGQ